jgi:pimeloyl-ACP methyl ester carboxylesterase
MEYGVKKTMGIVPQLENLHELRLDGIGGIEIGSIDADEALICLHGWGGSKEIWRRFMYAHGSGRRIVSLDLPGSGQSDPIREWSRDELSGWLERAMDRLGIRRAVLLAHSLGGNLALHAAANFPDRILAMALVAPAIYSDRLPSAKIYAAPIIGLPIAHVARLFSGALGWMSGIVPEERAGGNIRPLLRRSIYFFRDNTTRELCRQIAGMVRAPFDPHDLPISTGLLIIHGTEDNVIPIQHSRLFVEALWSQRENEQTRAKIIEYKNNHHTPMDTSPHRFLADINEFLDRWL